MRHLRPGTLDRHIRAHVIEQNEYGLPSQFRADDIVIDVGVHIGAFTYAALERGCRQVHGIEADRDNLRIAEANLQPFIEEGAVKLTHGAAWRSDPNDDVLFLSEYPSIGLLVNTGGRRVLLRGDGEPVPKINFDAYLLAATHNGERNVRFLKLDCEGSEWPILFTSKRLNLVDEIAGEFHEVAPTGSCDEFGQTFTLECLEKLLEDRGFDFTAYETTFQVQFLRRIGLFSARKKGAGAHTDSAARNWLIPRKEDE